MESADIGRVADVGEPVQVRVPAVVDLLGHARDFLRLVAYALEVGDGLADSHE